MYVVLREKIQKGISQKNRIQDTMNPWTYSYAKSQPLRPSKHSSKATCFKFNENLYDVLFLLFLTHMLFEGTHR